MWLAIEAVKKGEAHPLRFPPAITTHLHSAMAALSEVCCAAARDRRTADGGVWPTARGDRWCSTLGPQAAETRIIWWRWR